MSEEIESSSVDSGETDSNNFSIDENDDKIEQEEQ